LFIDWVVYSKRYPFEAKDFEGYDVNGHENLDISKEGYTFSITFFKDDNLTLAACKLVTANESEVWTTLNVAVFEKDTKFLSVQTHCTKRIFSAFLPKAKSPFTVKLFLRNNMCALDGGLPVIDRPILMTPELIPICGKIMQGNGQITMPVVYISHDYWPLDIDTAGLAKELQGLAHVLVEQDTATSMALKEASNGRNVYRGYIGLYFPGASYCRKFNLTEISGEQACNEIIDIVKSTLLNKADAARYTWEEIKAMADVFDAEKRSDIMKRVKSKGNKSTEIKLIEVFGELGIKGWRRNYSVKGHPDFVFPSKKAAIFVDGCFWHGHNCRNTIPKDNAEYWNRKRERNIQHDKEITEMFVNRGWKVIRIWECELKKANRAALKDRLLSSLGDN